MPHLTWLSGASSIFTSRVAYCVSAMLLILEPIAPIYGSAAALTGVHLAAGVIRRL